MHNRYSENNFEKNEIKVLTSELPKCYHVVSLIERVLNKMTVDEKENLS